MIHLSKCMRVIEVGIWKSPYILVKPYKSLIRPHMEYAYPVLDPYLRKDIRALENVQSLR